jgi:undecaprenyl-diphosphatase
MGAERLPLRHALALGAIQGPTELLPVSSSGHLALVPKLMRWPYAELDAELRKSFEVSLHAGTAVALLIGLRREVAEYAREFSAHNLLTLTLSFAPAALVAFRYERKIEQALSEPQTVALSLLGGSVVMALADGKPQERRREDARPSDAIVIGLAQAFALAPGVSRNGATLAAARWLRFKRRDSNVISRQIALPVIVGAAALKTCRLVARADVPSDVVRGMGVGATAAFASTLISMRLIDMLERSRSLLPYALYRTVLATTVLATLRRRRRRDARAQLQRQAVLKPAHPPASQIESARLAAHRAPKVL